MKLATQSRPLRTVSSILAIGALTIGIGACGSDEGGQEDAAAEPVVDMSKLDVGPYSTELKDWGMSKNPDQARMVEAERLANHVPPMSDVDPKYVHSSPFWSNIFIEPDNALGKIMAVDRFDEAAPDFISGFVTVASTERDNLGIDLLTAVMIFPDEQKAADSAAALERVDFEANSDNRPVEIPNYPEAHAHWQPGEQSIGSWLAVGNLVIYNWVYDYLKIWAETFDGPALTGLVEKTLDTVVPSVSKFQPTPEDKLMQEPIDMDGILGRTLQFNVDDDLLNPPGVYEGRAYIHFSSDPASARENVDEFGIDRYAMNGAQVFRARDGDAARNLADEVGGVSKANRRVDGPRALPHAQCTEYIGKQKGAAIPFYCTVSRGRFVAHVWSQQLLDAHQRISAQYRLLVNAE